MLVAGLDIAAREDRRRCISLMVNGWAGAKEGISTDAGEFGMELMWILGGRGPGSETEHDGEGMGDSRFARIDAFRNGSRSTVVMGVLSPESPDTSPNSGSLELAVRSVGRSGMSSVRVSDPYWKACGATGKHPQVLSPASIPRRGHGGYWMGRVDDDLPALHRLDWTSSVGGRKPRPT